MAQPAAGRSRGEAAVRLCCLPAFYQSNWNTTTFIEAVPNPIWWNPTSIRMQWLKSSCRFRRQIQVFFVQFPSASMWHTLHWISQPSDVQVPAVVCWIWRLIRLKVWRFLTCLTHEFSWRSTAQNEFIGIKRSGSNKASERLITLSITVD